MLHIMVPHAWLTYYESPGCPELPHRPSAKAEQVVLQGLAGQVPDWYTDNITNGAELWAAWLRSPSMPALANLAGGVRRTLQHRLDHGLLGSGTFSRRGHQPIQRRWMLSQPARVWFDADCSPNHLQHRSSSRRAVSTA